MKLIHKDTTEYSNGDWQRIYEFEVADINDLVALIKSLEDTYGPVEDILCIKKDDNNHILTYLEYDDLDGLKAKFKTFDLHNAYKFVAKESYISFVIDMNSKKLLVTNSEGTLGKRIYDPAKVKLYKDEYGNVVKYDENKQMIYTFDKEKDKWIKRRDLRNGFFDYDNGYTLISDEEANKGRR